MTRPTLWTVADAARATAAELDGTTGEPIAGVSIDSRSLQPGDLFVALRDARDGHDFVPAAFAAGASAALVAFDYVRKPADGLLLRVGEPLEALRRLATAARARLSAGARVVAVTGSVGKTGTTAMLRDCFSRLGPTHAPEKSFNNHWGVPLTLARMPAATSYAAIEIGMNHAGEITPLTRLARPHVAVVTAIEAVHIENFASIEGIADAKSEIFLGLEPGGVAVLPRDNPHYGHLARNAAAAGARIVSFGRDPEADVRAAVWEIGAVASRIVASVAGRDVAYVVGAPGEHLAANSLAVVAALAEAGVDLAAALPALAAFAQPAGRGARFERVAGPGRLLLIDESYNANPASMRAALAGLAMVPRENFPRRIAVLGDMLELGPDAGQMHESLSDAIDASGVDLVFAAGPHMRRLFDRIPAGRRGEWAPASSGLGEPLLAALGAGDAVMVKGSLGSAMGPLVTAVLARFPAVVRE